LIIPTPDVCAANRVKIRQEARLDLNRLYFISPAARDLGESAKAILIFPRIVKGSLKLELSTATAPSSAVEG
jgi:hypothetical protein